MIHQQPTDFYAHAKCILVGEHAVIRGYPAIVFPLKKLQMKFHYIDSDLPLKADYVGPYGESMLLMFWGTLKKAFELIERDINKVKGELIIENHIPLCAGLGFSAALCIAIGRWFIAQQWLPEDTLFDFARHLEDKFHQESSGVDIAGAMSDEAVIYYRYSFFPEKLNLAWQPQLLLSYSEQISVTAEAVKKIKDFFNTQHLLAKRIDLDMAESVMLAKKALEMDVAAGMSLLSQAIDLARDCFERWHLVTDKLQQHMETLKQLGALAVKPTGAGDGGYVLSLWHTLPEQLPFESYPVFL